MPEWKNWIMRIVTAAVVGGLADALTRKSRQNGLVRMTAALMLMLVAAAPLQGLDVQAWLTQWERQARNGTRAAEDGEAVQASLTLEYTAQQLSGYIESCAAAMEIVCSARVELDDTLLPAGVYLTLEGEPSDAAIEAFRKKICTELGLGDAQIEVTET